METQKKTPWWQTLPAVLTAIAGVLASITALVVALKPMFSDNSTAVAATPAAVVATAPVSVSGRWKAPEFTGSDSSGYIELTHRSDTVVDGFYNHNDDGRIVRGQLTGKSLTAFWVENSSNQRCANARDNSYYWGRVEFVFDETRQAFDGWWGYCDDKPTNAFNGRRL